jgi:hypothetical protein
MLNIARDDILDGIAKDLLNDGLLFLRNFNRNIGRYYTPDVKRRQLTADSKAKFLKFVNYGRPDVYPVRAKCLVWRDLDSGKLIFSKKSKAYAGSHYKEKLERSW